MTADFKSILDDLRRADALYRGVPSVDKWALTKIDDDVWRRQNDRLSSLKAASEGDALARAIETSLRAAAIDTGAIEGLYQVDRNFTMSVATEAAAWEASVNAKGERVRELFEAQLAAYQLALDAALPMGEAWVRRLHEEITAAQDTYEVLTPVGIQDQPLPKGEYKKQPNHVRKTDGAFHAYAPVARTADEMHSLIEILRSPAFTGLHPVAQAAFAHYALVAIHPFADGNGRVARILASVFLGRAASIPLLIFADDRDGYYESLAKADAGDLQAFVDYVFDRSVETIRFVGDQLKPSPESHIRPLRELLTAYGTLSHTDLDQVASGVLQRTEAVGFELAKELLLPNGVTIQTGQGRNSWPTPEGYRPLVAGGGNEFRQVLLVSAGPAVAQQALNFRTLVTKDKSRRYPILIDCVGREAIEVRLSEVYPAMTQGFDARIRAWLRGLIGEALKDLTADAAESLRKSGYPTP